MKNMAMPHEHFFNKNIGGNGLNKCAMLLINLDRDYERLHVVTKNLAEAGLSFERIPAFDADKEDILRCTIDHSAFKIIHGRNEIRKGEIGCYQSHLRAISLFLKSNKEFAIIIEDDVSPAKDFKRALAQLIEWKNDWDIVPLFHFHRGGPIPIKANDSFELHIFLAHISSSAAYMINRRAASVLLKYMEIQKSCVDHALFANWSHGLKLRGISPETIKLSSLANNSTINSEISGKLPAYLRLPTFSYRTITAIRVLMHAIKEIIFIKLKLA